jgi:hypothetical protein
MASSSCIPSINPYIASPFLSVATANMADMATCGHIVWDTIRNNKDNLVALHETRAPAWVPETEIRGTFSILLTCLVTLTACVYSAIHLNVPLETGFRHNIARKAGWVVVALVAPELVVMTALTQFLVAWRLSSDLQQLQKDARRDKVDKNACPHVANEHHAPI